MKHTTITAKAGALSLLAVILLAAGAHSVESYCAAHGGKPVPAGYAYDSGSNPDFLTVEQLRNLIAQQVANAEELGA